jgi:pimeloyl-ACP methyl ester carboxylesterase
MLAGRLLKPDGRSCVVATRRDPRCSYSFYAPPNWRKRRKFQNLLVYIHGEGRRFQFLLSSLRPLARECGYVVVCPLFPANLLRDGNLSGYKYLREGEIRYDEVVLDIVSEIREVFPFKESRFLLGGFSGGGQFAHRFAYLYPEMLKAVSIAAPGNVTLLDDELEWWAGTGSIERVFGREIEREVLRKIEFQLIVGDADTEEDAREVDVASEEGLLSVNTAGSNRIERLHSLHASFIRSGITANFEIVPKVGHSFVGLAPKITEFLGRSPEYQEGGEILESQ